MKKVSRRMYRGKKRREKREGPWTPVERMVDVSTSTSSLA